LQEASTPACILPAAKLTSHKGLAILIGAAVRAMTLAASTASGRTGESPVRCLVKLPKVSGRPADEARSMNKAKRLLIVAGAAIFGVILLVVGFKEYRQSKKLQSEGKTAVGAVTDASIQRGRKGRRSYYLTVNFQTEAGAAVEQRKRVSSSVYDEARQAGTVPVTYLASDPKVCAFGPKVSTKFGSLIAGVVALAVGGFAAFGKSEDDGSSSPLSGEAAENELLADNSRYDDQQKAA
jgi:hypothetical protein